MVHKPKQWPRVTFLRFAVVIYLYFAITVKMNTVRDKDNRGKTSHCRCQSLKSRQKWSLIGELFNSWILCVLISRALTCFFMSTDYMKIAFFISLLYCSRKYIWILYRNYKKKKKKNSIAFKYWFGWRLPSPWQQWTLQSLEAFRSALIKRCW